MTYMFALMGIQSSPAFSMWSFANKDPAPFAPQQVWASSFGIGLILFFFTVAQGMGAHFLGATPAVGDAAGIANVLPDLTANKQGGLVPHYINLVARRRHGSWDYSPYVLSQQCNPPVQRTCQLPAGC